MVAGFASDVMSASLRRGGEKMETYSPIGIKVILEYDLTDLWIDKESLAEDADYWTDERIIELVQEDVSVMFDYGQWRVERE